MQIVLKMIRRIKANIIRFRLHTLLNPLLNPVLTFCYAVRLSRWVRKTSMPRFDDFYSRKHNYNKRYDLYAYLIESEKLDDIFYLEFGVAQGKSFKWWVEHVPGKKSKFVGFDTFTGLPEDWGTFKKGDMSSEGNVPEIHDRRCRFIRGIFQDTLQGFLDGFRSDLRKVIHLDADIYSSTLYVLTRLAGYLKAGDILIFDEFNVPLHEFRAYLDFIKAYHVETQVIGAVNNYYQVAFRITKV